jgi:DNA replication protein DnaC
MMTNTLKQHVRSLHLSGLLNSLELRLQEAEANRLPYAQFLELLLQDEINVRHQRMIARRHKWADFREPRSLENFDFGFNPGIKRTQVYELAACHFVRQCRDVLLVGPPGVGKSHLVQAIGLEALKAGFVVLYRSIFDLVRELLAQETQAGESRLLNKYLKPDLLIIDDMGLKVLPPKSGEILLEIIMRRYENRSTMMTSNRPIEEWGKLLSDVPAASYPDSSLNWWSVALRDTEAIESARSCLAPSNQIQKPSATSPSNPSQPHPYHSITRRMLNHSLPKYPRWI